MPSRSSLLSVVFLLLAALLMLSVAGCGGGQSGEGQGSGGGPQEGGGGKERDAPEVKIAIGKILSVKPEARRFALKPAGEGEKTTFKLRKEQATVTLDGEDAGLEDVQKGQQAKVEYVTVNDKNRARSMQLFSVEGSEGGGGNTN